MKIKPYNKLYLEDVMDNLGSMLEYAVGCDFNAIAVWEMFVSSKVALEIEKGNPKYLSGYSAREYLDVIFNTNPVYERKLSNKLLQMEELSIVDDRYYWAGWAIAYLQYETGLSFYNINKYLPIQDVLEMYNPLHEADIRKFLDIAVNIIKNKKKNTNLKLLRKAIGLTQKELSERANVDLRSIQMYEQRHNDINKAQGVTLYNLSRVLGCNMEDLLEFV